MDRMRGMMEALKLTVNEKKTRQCSLPEETFTFLGFTFGRQVSWKKGRAYISPAPAKKKILGVCRKLSEVTSRSTTWRSIGEEVAQLNQVLRGWGNYFRLGAVTGAWKVVQQHACRRLRWWLRRKRGEQGGHQGYPDMQLYDKYGLLNLSRSLRRIFLWAKA
jgi:hypothetical protein